MAKVELEAREREEIGKGLKALRKQGLIPAVIYGRKLRAISIAVEKKAFEKNILRSEAGKNAIVALKIAGAEIPAITTEIQRNALTDEIIHIDFNNIVMDELIKTKVPIELEGLPIGVKETGGVLIHALREVEVECLPGDIPDKFKIDVSALQIGDALHVSDLAQVAKVKILTNLSEMVASCSPPTKEEEVAAPLPTPAEGEVAAEGVEGVPEAAAEEKGKEKTTAPGATTVASPAPPAKPEKKTS